MIHFMDLPVEIILEIYAYLDIDGRRAMCRVFGCEAFPSRVSIPSQLQ